LPTSGTFTVIIENNIIKKNRYGIALNGSVNAIIRGNTIDSNNIQGIPSQGGSGLNFVGSGINAKVSKNIIRWNLWGVTLQSSAAPVFGDLSISDTNYNGLNYIFYNSNSGLFYDFYNNTSQPIKAENNYWGTGNLDSIEAHIFHQVDSAALGFVDFMPIFIPVGIEPISSELPSEFKLYNAYPNPFNPNTKIKFQIPLNSSERVKLSIYDISGKLIKVIVNQILQAGTYEIDFNAIDMASGVYFYTLRSGSFVQSKKIILIK
jgi:parallel beta-helix repeat protein